MEDENWTNLVSNAQSWEWLKANIPLFECPDAEVQEIYYFRWWSFRKHVVRTPKGFIFTEFLLPVRHAGNRNTISCAVGHHVAEGRWLVDPRYLDDYIRYWLRGNRGKPQPHFHSSSSWFAAAAYDRFLVNGNAVCDQAAGLQPRRRLPVMGGGTPAPQRPLLAIRCPRRHGGIHLWLAHREKHSSHHQQLHVRNARIAAIARLARRPALAREFDLKAADLSG
jgi:hypothetical protein